MATAESLIPRAIAPLRRRLLLALAVFGAGRHAGLSVALAAGANHGGDRAADPAAGSRASIEGPPQPPYAPVVPGHRLAFPHDHGMHPDFRIEWWYITGWLDAAARGAAGAGRRGDHFGPRDDVGPYGFQITFFRVRTRHALDNPSRFAPRQLLLAHAAIADPALGRLRHDQQAWRTGELATVAAGDTAIELPGWRLLRNVDDTYLAEVDTGDFGYSLRLHPSAPPLPQGDGGYSRKGPRPEQASYYYSRPGLRAEGTLRMGDREYDVRGSGWLDHEWSSELMPEAAVGWDWTGINLDDGGSLLAFRLRDVRGGAVHSHGRLRDRHGDVLDAPPVFSPRRFWESPRTGIRYPVEWIVTLGDKSFVLRPLFDDQELDARGSSGTVYWEGAVTASLDGHIVGRGYLELTGYGTPIEL